MNIEVLVKVGSLEGSWQDGDVIAVALPGDYFTSTECQAWFANGTVPNGFASLPRYRRQLLKRRFLEMRELNLLTAEQIATAFSITLADAQERKSRNTADVNKATTLGVDSNWGWSDLSNHLAVAITNAPETYIRELLVPDLNETDWKIGTLKKRSWRAANWRSGLTAGQISTIENPTAQWTCKRGQMQNAATFFEYVP